MREAELKHCRLAMLAVVGALGQELGIVFPGQPTGKDQIDVFWQVIVMRCSIVSGSYFLPICDRW